MEIEHLEMLMEALHLECLFSIQIHYKIRYWFYCSSNSSSIHHFILFHSISIHNSVNLNPKNPVPVNLTVTACIFDLGFFGSDVLVGGDLLVGFWFWFYPIEDLVLENFWVKYSIDTWVLTIFKFSTLVVPIWYLY